MTTWFISRHPGAVEWARRSGRAVDRWQAHLDTAQVHPGDTVIGTLPVHLAAQVCARGAHYLHLSLDLPAPWRGRELSADDLCTAGARLEAYHVLPGAHPHPPDASGPPLTRPCAPTDAGAASSSGSAPETSGSSSVDRSGQ
jgi:CRISPR-associated protein Csx16